MRNQLKIPKLPRLSNQNERQAVMLNYSDITSAVAYKQCGGSEHFEKMYGEIQKSGCKTVCFKMFGTLILPPFSDSEELFLLMEEDFRKIYSGGESFVQLRIISEDIARKKFSGKCSVTIGQIYDILMKRSGISQEERDMLLEQECRLFSEMSYFNRGGCSLYRMTARGKQHIIVAADTIYPRSVIVDILKKWQLSGYDSLIMTSETNMGVNADEAVFADIMRKAKCPPQKLMNIGTDVHADVEIPIMNGAKALMVTAPDMGMIKSGRLRGYVQDRLIYDHDSPEYLALNGAFSIYGGYLFSQPCPKTVHSDFCGDSFKLGYIVFGALSLAENFDPKSEIQRALISAFQLSDEMRAGAEAFKKQFSLHYDGIVEKFGAKGCEIPLEFIERHCDSEDRKLFKEYLEPKIYEKWERSVSEPKTAPVGKKAPKQNFTSRLADKMFPPGTKVRNMADGMLMKMKKRR